MNDIFEKRVWAAAVAGWWTLLIAGLILLFQYFAVLFMMWKQPAWMLPLFGPDMDWHQVQHLALNVFVAFKLCFLLALVVVVWLTLWARQMRSLN